MDGREGRPNDRDLAEQVLDTFRRDGKIAAVKLYIDLTGVGLAEAKGAVEAIERGASGVRGETDSTSALPDEDEIERETMRRLTADGKIQAVKYFMERTGMSLGDAKTAVERLAALHGLPAEDPRGCLGAVLFVVIPAIGLLLRWSA